MLYLSFISKIPFLDISARRCGHEDEKEPREVRKQQETLEMARKLGNSENENGK